jgi:23S rRNA pseudouridine1911/1915/1917 synthase
MTFKELEVIYEDNHLIAVNKPSGVLVQPDKSGDAALEDLIKEYIKDKYQKPGDVFIGVCHRIDRPVSGVVLFAKTSKALVRINEMFQKREIQKTYWAVVENSPEEKEGRLTHWLLKDEKKKLSKAHNHEVKYALKSELDYKWIANSDRYFLLEILPHTGRHHQIRAQLSKIGCSIKGDVKYGAKRTNPDGRIHLHARQLAFTHPVKLEAITITAPLPNEVIWQAMDKIVSEKSK